jgi:hypothetical protein
VFSRLQPLARTLLWDVPEMDSQLTGSVIAIAAALPYVIEVLSQVPLLTRVMEALPDEVRAGLPAHPRRHGLALFGSARFFMALFRYALRDDAADGPAMARLKRKMRASAVREGLLAVLMVGIVMVLWRGGWRPCGITPDG